MTLFSDKLDRIIEIVQENPWDFDAAIAPITSTLMENCSCSLLFRQRLCMALISVEYSVSSSELLTRLQGDKIISQFLVAASDFLQLKGSNFLQYYLDDELDDTLLENALIAVCKVKPRKHVDFLNRFFSFEAQDSMPALLEYVLEEILVDYPRSVLSWIRWFELHKFKKRLIEPLLMSTLLHKVDIAKLVLDDNVCKREVLHILDNFTSDKGRHCNFDQFEVLYQRFFKEFSKNDISIITFEFAKSTNFDLNRVIPSTLAVIPWLELQEQLKSMSDLKVGFRERSALVLRYIENEPTLRYNATVNSFIINIFDHDKMLAVAVAILAGWSDSKIKKLAHEHPEFDASDQMLLTKHLTELQTTSKTKVSRFWSIQSTERVEVYLVDDLMRWLAFVQWIQERKKMIAFDVEAGYACQLTKAPLIQIAGEKEGYNNNAVPCISVFLIDIISLNSILDEYDWRLFFELLFRPQIQRICFGIRSKLAVLQNTFPFLNKYLEERVPICICMQEFMKNLTNNNIPCTMAYTFSEPKEFTIEALVKAACSHEMSHSHQKSDWENRPLSIGQMAQTAKTAFYSIVCYWRVKQRLKTFDRIFLISKFGRVRLHSILSESGTSSMELKKETVNELLDYAVSLSKLYDSENSSTDYTIAVDVGHLKLVPVLQRLGFKVWDHRLVDPRPDKRTTQILGELAVYLSHQKRTSWNYEDLYLLTDQKSRFTDLYDEIDAAHIILMAPDLPAATIIAKMFEMLEPIVDLEMFEKCCIFCRNSNTTLAVPMSVYRIICRSYLKWKGENMDDIFDADELDRDRKAAEEIENVTFGEKAVCLVHEEFGTLKFRINGMSDVMSITKIAKARRKEDADGLCCSSASFKIDEDLLKNRDRTGAMFCVQCLCFF